MTIDYNAAICGLVTRSSSTKRTRSPHRRAGLTKLRVPVVAAPKWTPILSPFTYVGFCFGGRLTRQGALANGLHGLNPRNAGTASLADAPTGLSARDRARFCGKVVKTANLPSESQRQACRGPLCSMSDKDAGGGQKHTVSPLPELWINDFDGNGLVF